MKKINHRLKRLVGQLNKVETEIARGAVCTTVIPQLLAVRGALQATTLAYLEESLLACEHTSSSAEMALILKTIIKKG